MRPTRRCELGALLWCLLAGAATAGSTEHDIQARVAVEQRLGQSVPLAVPLRDEEGVLRPLADYLHYRPAVIALVYFDCPNLCSLTLTGLAQGLQGIALIAGRDYEVLAVSIDPREGPLQAAARRAAYLSPGPGHAARTCDGCDSGWHFLTGRPEAISSLATALGYHYFWDPQLQQFAHPAGVVLVSAQGLITQYLNGVAFPPAELHRALSRAASGNPGPLAGRLWLLCFHYDALTGRYSTDVRMLLRLLGVVTLLLLAVLIVRLQRASP
jgi:protein SCO1/2